MIKDRITIERFRRVKREGSPPYVWNVPATNAGLTATIHVPTQFPASRKYEPLDYIEIVNNETACPLTLTINGNTTEQRLIPSSSIKTIHGNGVALWSIALTNNGAGATTLGSIYCTLQREPQTIDRWASQR